MPDGNSPIDMGVPWSSLSGLAGGDPQTAQNIGQGAEVDPALSSQLDKLKFLSANMKVANEAAQAPPQPTKVTTKTSPDGKKSISIEGDASLAEYYGKAGSFYQQAMGGMQQELQRMDMQLKQREQQARNQPAWVQLATALSANLAQQKDMPGWVKGLGQTAAQLNPSADQIRQQRMQVMGEEANLAERGQGLGMQRERLDLETTRETRLAGDETRKVAEDKLRDVRDTRDKFLAAAEKGEAPPPEVLSSMFAERGLEPKVAATFAEAITKTNEAAQARIKADMDFKAAKEAAAQKASDARLGVMMKGLAIKSSDKSDADKAIEETAQSIAKGDMSSIKDVSSFRGSERTKIYARAKEINPNFSVAETKRKIDMEQSFTVGKDGQSIQSFGTFLEHAGELSEAIKNVSQTSSPALNKPINWLRKNAEGNPEYQRLLTAIEPVGKEFESFLLNQRALYVDDRKRIDILLNGNSSPAQIMAALNQMGKTAKDRYTEMNQRYKRVMKQDIPDAFGPEAVAGAAKVGIALPQAQAATQAPPDPLEGRTATGPNGQRIVRKNGQWVPM